MKKPGDQKNIYLLGTSSFLNDAGSEMITPILPFFIESLGGGGLSIGLISGLREGLSSLLKLFGGWFSDRIGKRREIVFFGYIVSAILKLFISIAQTPTQIISFVSLERFGKIRDSPRDAIIARSTNKTGNGFGIHQMFDSIGGVLGTILVILLFMYLKTDFRSIVLIAGGVSLLSIIPLFFVKDKSSEKINLGIVGSVKSLSKNLRNFIYITTLFAFANFGIYMFLMVKTQEISGSTIFTFSLYAMFSLICALSSKFFGKISDKVGRKPIIVSGYILFLLVCLGFANFSSLILISLMFGVYGVVFAMTDPIQKAFVSDLSKENKGTAMGFYYFSRGISIIFGGILGGYLWSINQSLMFYFLGFVSVISAILLIRYKK